MKFIDYLKNTNSDLLEKVASIKEDALIDLLEKQAEYTINLLLEKLAENSEQGVDPNQEVPVTEQVTGGQNNYAMDDNKPSSSIKVNDIKNAVQEAIAANQSEKIISFVQVLSQQQSPEILNEVIKIIKVQLQSAFMNKQIDEESALKVSNALNELLDGGKNE